MARLMEDLLDLSRITRDILELRKQPTDLRAVIRDAIETSRPLIEAGQHELTADLPEQNLTLNGDPTRLVQVFANLLNNAAKYMEGSGQIHLKAEPVPRAEKGQPTGSDRLDQRHGYRHRAGTTSTPFRYVLSG